MKREKCSKTQARLTVGVCANNLGKQFFTLVIPMKQTILSTFFIVDDKVESHLHRFLRKMSLMSFGILRGILWFNLPSRSLANGVSEE